MQSSINKFQSSFVMSQVEFGKGQPRLLNLTRTDIIENYTVEKRSQLVNQRFSEIKAELLSYIANNRRLTFKQYLDVSGKIHLLLRHNNVRGAIADGVLSRQLAKEVRDLGQKYFLQEHKRILNDFGVKNSKLDLKPTEFEAILKRKTTNPKELERQLFDLASHITQLDAAGHNLSFEKFLNTRELAIILFRTPGLVKHISQNEPLKIAYRQTRKKVFDYLDKQYGVLIVKHDSTQKNKTTKKRRLTKHELVMLMREERAERVRKEEVAFGTAVANNSHKSTRRTRVPVITTPLKTGVRDKVSTFFSAAGKFFHRRK